MGSTGWFKSLMTGAVAIANAASGREARPPASTGFSWDAEYLYFTVREPFPSKTSSATLVFGRVDKGEPLVLVSQMPDSGVIFSDGILTDYVQFNSGTTAVIAPAERKGHLIV